MEQALKLNNKIYSLLISSEMNNFTMKEFQAQFYQLGLSSGCHKKDRKFLYRQLFMLEDKRLLEKKGSSYSRDIRYQKTPLFNQKAIVPKNPDLPIVGEKNQAIKLPNVPELRRLLAEYQIKFVASLGESEEYQKMLNEFPAMSIYIKDQYYQTRENSTKYLGKINAIKKIIQRYGEQV